MIYKKFVSNQGWLSMDYPSTWSQYEEDEGTYLFMDDDNWKGNFRITPIKISGNDEDSIDLRLKKYIEDEIINNKGAQLVKIGQFESAHYSKSTIQDKQSLTMLYWVFRCNQVIITATFTIDSDRLNNNDVKMEIEHCLKSIETLKID
jgi:Domain of unknown function (DUF3805)